MQNMMKYICLLVLLTLAVSAAATNPPKPVNYVKIEHLGFSDKPIPDLIISDGPMKQTGVAIQVILPVSHSAFESVHSHVNGYIKKSSGEEPSTYEYGTFKTTTQRNGYTLSYTTFPASQSVRFFRWIQRMLNYSPSAEKKRINDALDDIIRRLE